MIHQSILRMAAITLALMEGVSSVHATTTTLSLNPAKRLSVRISQDSMNRIAVANDRITQVFGDNDAYDIQTEDTTGQIFIKPILENGDKPLAITLITEKNITQDLTLNPEIGSAATVVLKGPGTPTADRTRSGALGEAPFMDARMSSGFAQGGYGYPGPDGGAARSGGPSIQDAALDAIKWLASGSVPSLEEEADIPPRKNYESCQVQVQSLHQLSGFQGVICEVCNTGKTTTELNEDDVYTQGDVALSLEKTILKPGETARLYVVR